MKIKLTTDIVDLNMKSNINESNSAIEDLLPKISAVLERTFTGDATAQSMESIMDVLVLAKLANLPWQDWANLYPNFQAKVIWFVREAIVNRDPASSAIFVLAMQLKMLVGALADETIMYTKPILEGEIAEVEIESLVHLNVSNLLEKMMCYKVLYPTEDVKSRFTDEYWEAIVNVLPREQSFLYFTSLASLRVVAPIYFAELDLELPTLSDFGAMFNLNNLDNFAIRQLYIKALQCTLIFSASQCRVTDSGVELGEVLTDIQGPGPQLVY